MPPKSPKPPVEVPPVGPSDSEIEAWAAENMPATAPMATAENARNTYTGKGGYEYEVKNGQLYIIKSPKYPGQTMNLLVQDEHARDAILNELQSIAAAGIPAPPGAPSGQAAGSVKPGAPGGQTTGSTATRLDGAFAAPPEATTPPKGWRAGVAQMGGVGDFLDAQQPNGARAAEGLAAVAQDIRNRKAAAPGG